MLRILLQASENEIDTSWATDALLVIGGVALGFALIFVSVMAIFGLALRRRRRRRLAKSGIEDIDAMGGRTFEHYLEALFLKLGYKVELSKYFSDYGGDLAIQKDRVRTIVQAKRWKRNVGIEAVQQVVAAKAVYRCTEAMVVTNSYYTRAALELARKNRVTMWDRDKLITELQRASAKTAALSREPEPRHAPGVAVDGLTEGDNAAVVAACATCSKILTSGERQYCERNKTRFGGKLLCFRHQRSPRPAAPPR